LSMTDPCLILTGMTRILRFSYLLCLFLAYSTMNALAQSSYLPLNEDYYHTIDRYEIKTGKVLPQVFTSVKPYKRSDIVDFADSVQQMGVFTSRSDQFNYEYLLRDSWEWSNSETNTSKRPILKYFYRKKSDFIHVAHPDFDLHVNPVLYLGAGKDTQRDDMLFINARGAEIRGMVDKKIGFYAYFADNQMVMPSYVWDEMSRNPVIPHEGFWKRYKDGVGVDFLQARGSITVDVSKHINVQLGHDRFFVGNGYRSLVFSDNPPPSLFFKAAVKVWKLNYLFLLNQMTADVKGTLGGLTSEEGGYPQKFTALHHLSINIGKKLNIGVFESVIFSADDTTGVRMFRLDYINPVIFYRAIEQQNGSSDNVLLGLDFKWNMVRKLSVYGQFMLDEFVISNIRDGNGWWANKFAVQAGAKYIDAFGVPNLDLQGEINLVRPYTYTHDTQYGNYSSYRQSMAHPLGANFNEVVGILRYQPLPKLTVVGKLVLTQIGRDSTTTSVTNYGSNILRNNSTRNNGTGTKDFGNTIGQGESNDIVFGTFTASWQFKHNLFIDAQVVIRQSKSELAFYNKNTSITSLALRWNIPKRLYEF
jgi:hypothetical protein